MLAWMQEMLGAFLDTLLGVLPTSPFRQFLSDFASIPYLGWLNWFVPVGDMLKVMVAWCGSIATFYLYSIVMRWIKMIGD